MANPRILIIDDEPDLREVLASIIGERYEVSESHGGYEGLKSAIRNPPALILLDLKMPDFKGFDLCRLLRLDPEFNSIPIIVLSGCQGTEDRTRSFALGADDYISKPFDSGELLARIERKLKTFEPTVPQPVGGPGVVKCGNLKVNAATHEAFVGENQIHLGALECRLLYLLVANSEKLLSRQQIIQTIWEGQEVSSRIVDPHILSLRTKLTGSSHLISSVYKGGYALKEIK